MSNLSFWQITGENVERFLQGQLTVDITKGNRFFCYCNAKGRVCTLGWVFRFQDDWAIAIPEQNSLAMFEAWAPYARLSNIQHQQLFKLSWDFNTKEKRALIIEPGTQKQSNWDEWAIANDIPVITPVTMWQYTPHMLGVHAWGGIDFDKGCYLGQEIIARTQHLGKQKRTMIRFRNLEKIIIGQKIQDQSGNECGEILYVGRNTSQAIVSLGNEYYINQNKLDIF